MYNNALTHYGVKGMKWGVRRVQPKSRIKRLRKSQKALSPEQMKRQSMKKAVKNRRLLSDEEINRKIERLKLERQLKDLTAESITPGRKFVSSVLSSSGRKVASSLVTGATLYGVKAAMTREFNLKDAASYMTPKPKK